MQHRDLCVTISNKLSGKLSYEQVRLVMDNLGDIILDIMADGDDVKIKELGTLWPCPYTVRRGSLEFLGRKGQNLRSEGGNRVRIRFRPLEKANYKLTQTWTLFENKKSA